MHGPHIECNHTYARPNPQRKKLQHALRQWKLAQRLDLSQVQPPLASPAPFPFDLSTPISAPYNFLWRSTRFAIIARPVLAFCHPLPLPPFPLTSIFVSPQKDGCCTSFEAHLAKANLKLGDIGMVGQFSTFFMVFYSGNCYARYTAMYSSVIAIQVCWYRRSNAAHTHIHAHSRACQAL